MVSINCLETIFEISKCDLTKTKSSIQQLHQNAAFVIISLVFHWLYFNKLGINLTQLESQEFSVAWRYRISNEWSFFWGIFKSQIIFSLYVGQMGDFTKTEKIVRLPDMEGKTKSQNQTMLSSYI